MKPHQLAKLILEYCTWAESLDKQPDLWGFAQWLLDQDTSGRRGL